jgi:hypothetical protein
MMTLLLFALLLVPTASGDSIYDGWRGIKPLRTTKATVDKMLGVPVIDDNGYAGYPFEEGFVQVNYSSIPCAGNQYNRGKYDVPENTVLDSRVSFHKHVKSSDLEFDRDRYVRQTNDHAPGLVYYQNRKTGVLIGIEIQQGKEYLGTLTFRPTEADKEKFKCKIEPPGEE